MTAPHDGSRNAAIEKHLPAVIAKRDAIFEEMMQKAKAIRDAVDLDDPESMRRGGAEVQALMAEGHRQLLLFVADLLLTELLIEPLAELLTDQMVAFTKESLR